MSKLSGYPEVSKSGSALRAGLLACALAVVVTVTGAGGWAVAQVKDDQVKDNQGEDKLSKFLLIKLSREQSQVLCQSEVFTACMGFTEQACLELSEEALQQCIVPLPDTINLQDLNSEVLEACPQEVYEEAGYRNEKATACLEEAWEN